MNEIVKDEAITGRIMSAAEVKGCEICGQVREDVRVTIDPYQAQVWDEDIEMRLCDDCHQARSDDV